MTRTKHKLILSATVGICAAAGLGMLLQMPGEETSPITGDAVTVSSEPPAGPMTADFPSLMMVPRSVPEPGPGAAVIVYPDGTRYPTLNGVAAPIKLNWSSDRPYSPIVGTMYDGELNQLYWYVHADGSYSTTAMMQNRRGGAPVPTGIVQAELASLPASMMARSTDK
jgi:hypothetical protein